MLAQSATDNRKLNDRPVLRTLSPEQATRAINHTNQLLDRVEELLIDNSALTTALDAVKRLLPPEAQDMIRSHIDGMRSDPALRELTRREFACFRDPSFEGCVSELLEQHLKRAVKSSGVPR
jgi:hypothetical protein